MRRLIAIFFLLAFAGQIFAGTCGCLKADAKNGREMACCKRDKTGAANFSRPPCCDSPCIVAGNSSGPATRSESFQKKFAPADSILEPIEAATIQCPIPGTFSFIGKNLSDHNILRRSRSPDLYLRYHAFRI